MQRTDEDPVLERGSAAWACREVTGKTFRRRKRRRRRGRKEEEEEKKVEDEEEKGYRRGLRTGRSQPCRQSEGNIEAWEQLHRPRDQVLLRLSNKQGEDECEGEGAGGM